MHRNSDQIVHQTNNTKEKKKKTNAKNENHVKWNWKKNETSNTP